MADYVYILPTGTVVPDTADQLGEVEEEWRTALGDDLDVSPSTPQGVLIAAEATARDSVARNNAALANQINPNLSGGKFLDAIWALTGGERSKATRTTVQAQITGVATTIIPALSQAQNANGDVFENPTVAVIAADGTVSVLFQAVEFGPIAVPAGSLTQIVSDVLGWETITNADAGIPGELEQSDPSARLKRRNELALQGQSVAEAITSGLYSVPGVRSLTFRENVLDTTEVIDGITLLPKSIWACVYGGTDADVAAMLLEKKSAGANWNGLVTVDVLEPASGQEFPVSFDRPDVVAVQARFTVRANGAVSDPEQLVKGAVVAYANGLVDGEAGFVVGGAVSPFELAGAVNIQAPGLFVQLVEVKKTTDVAWTTLQIDIALNEIATITESNVTVTVV